jgi:hypothetical protein
MSKSPQVKTFRVAETPFLLLRRRVPFPPGKHRTAAALKVHKNENFFGFDFEFCTISMKVMHK